MTKYYLAIDIGATSGRHILAHYENNELVFEEVYRFLNKMDNIDGKLYWNVDLLFKNIINGLKECKKLNKIPTYLGIDTFGVDYCLLDENDKLVRNIYSYRDNRGEVAKKEFKKEIEEVKLFEKTGVFPNYFNTLYQLYDDSKKGLLKKTKTIMYYPCYLTYLLSGVKNNELSIASTSGILNKNTIDYDEDLLKILGIKKDIFAPIFEAGSVIGSLKEEIQKEVGFNCEIKEVCCHDTASATIGGNVKQGEVFISSGTWSLIGVINDKYLANKEILDAKFTNELNRKNEVRFLKNIVGMYIINEVQKELKEKLTIQEIVEQAKLGKNYQEIFDPTDSKFLCVKSMTQEIIDDYKNKGINPPSNNQELFFAVYNSLAHAYKKSIEEIEKITGKTYEIIKIFGGGVKNKFLNSLTQEITNKKVVEGPSEATAFGNIYLLID